MTKKKQKTLKHMLHDLAKIGTFNTLFYVSGRPKAPILKKAASLLKRTHSQKIPPNSFYATVDGGMQFCWILPSCTWTRMATVTINPKGEVLVGRVSLVTGKHTKTRVGPGRTWLKEVVALLEEAQEAFGQRKT